MNEKTLEYILSPSQYLNFQPPPPMANLRTVKKQRYFKTAVLENGGKGRHIIYNHKRTYSGLENQRGIGGRSSIEGWYWAGGLLILTGYYCLISTVLAMHFPLHGAYCTVCNVLFLMMITNNTNHNQYFFQKVNLQILTDDRRAEKIRILI